MFGASGPPASHKASKTPKPVTAKKRLTSNAPVAAAQQAASVQVEAAQQVPRTSRRVIVPTADENELARQRDALREREVALSLGEAAASGCTERLAAAETEIVDLRSAAEGYSQKLATAKENEREAYAEVAIARKENLQCAESKKIVYAERDKFKAINLEQEREFREKLSKCIGKPQYAPRGYLKPKPHPRRDFDESYNADGQQSPNIYGKLADRNVGIIHQQWLKPHSQLTRLERKRIDAANVKGYRNTLLKNERLEHGFEPVKPWWKWSTWWGGKKRGGTRSAKVHRKQKRRVTRRTKTSR